MAEGISTSFVAEYSADVKHEYQTGGVGLLNAVKQRNNVTGSTYRFHTMGKGLATARIPLTEVVPMNITPSTATATLTDWTAAAYSDVFDLEKLSYDEKSELVKTSAMAIRRRAEQLVINALDTGANATQVSTDVGGTATGLNVEKILQTKFLMDDAGVPMEDRYFLHDSKGLQQMLNLTPVTSADFNSVRALVSGQVNTFLGFKFICFETRTEGGIATTAGVTKNFAFHKESIGLAVGMDFRTEINYIPNKTSWLINTLYSAGSVVIDDAGVYEVLSTYAY